MTIGFGPPVYLLIIQTDSRLSKPQLSFAFLYSVQAFVVEVIFPGH